MTDAEFMQIRDRVRKQMTKTIYLESERQLAYDAMALIDEVYRYHELMRALNCHCAFGEQEENTSI